MAVTQSVQSVTQRPIFRNLGSNIFLVILGILVAFPLVLIFSQSLMTNQEMYRWPPQIVTMSPTIDNYHNLLTRPDLQLPIWLRNSLYAATMYTLVVVVICAPAAYAFARLKFPGNNVLVLLLLIPVVVPSPVTLIAQFML